MGSRYVKICSVHVLHKYFTDLVFPRCQLIPTEETKKYFTRYGWLVQSAPGVFSIFLATPFEGRNRDKETVLKESITLQFLFHITDSSFYDYTGNLPQDSAGQIFWFSNFDDKQQAYRDSDVLHESAYVSETELRKPSGPLNYAGYVNIQFEPTLKEKLYIRFANRSTHWRYIIESEKFREFEKLSILDKGNRKVFSGPELVRLPDGSRGFAFTSDEPIEATQSAGQDFRLVFNYDKKNSHFERELNILPIPKILSDSILTAVVSI